MAYLALSGCAKSTELSTGSQDDSGFKLSDSPNFNKSTKRFQHPAGDLNKKALATYLVLFKNYLRRMDDWENTGFPVMQISTHELQNLEKM